MLAALAPLLAPKALEMVDGWLKRAFPDPLEQQKQALELIQVLNQSNLAQAKINEVEAASSSLFVAGWRPWIGWVCGMAFAWTFVGAPVLAYLLTLYSPGTPLPVIPTDNLMELVLAMLGFGGLRSWEKVYKSAK